MITKSMIKTWSKKKYHKHFFELQNCKHKSSISVFDIKKKRTKKNKINRVYNGEEYTKII